MYLHPGPDQGRVDGLDDEIRGPGRQGPQLTVRVAGRGDEEDGEFGMARLEGLAGGETVQAGHPGIEEDQIRGFGPDQVQGLGAGQGEPQIPQVGQGLAQDLDGGGLVVNDQDPGERCHKARSLVGDTYGRSGDGGFPNCFRAGPKRKF